MTEAMAQIVWQDVSSARYPLSVTLEGLFNPSKLNKVQGVFPPKGSFVFGAHLSSEILCFQVQHGYTFTHTLMRPEQR